MRRASVEQVLEVFEQLLQHPCLGIEDRTVVEQALAGVRSGLGFARRIRQLNLPPWVVIPRAA